MLRTTRIALLATCCLGSVLVTAAYSQQAPPANAPANNNGARATRTTQAGTATDSEFQQIFTKWVATLKGLREIQQQFQTASEDHKVALRAEFRQRMTKARTLAPKLIASAEKAYVDKPNQDEQVTGFLVRIVFDNLRSDNYEEALRLSKILIDGKAQDKRIYLLGGIAAFAANDYDAASNYLKAAADAGLFAQQGQKQSGLVRKATQDLADLEKTRQLWDVEQKIRQSEAAADDLPRVKLETSKGEIVLELFENEAPNTVANFISLVEKGFYDGTSFHRVLPGFMAQGGDPKGDGTGGPGYHIACESYQKNARRHFRGSLSMAHAGRDTGGSQFFMTFVRTAHLDGKHTVFGRVLDGINVLSRLTRIDPSHPRPGSPRPDKIIKATVIRKRDHAYQPKKLPATS